MSLKMLVQRISRYLNHEVRVQATEHEVKSALFTIVTRAPVSPPDTREGMLDEYIREVLNEYLPYQERGSIAHQLFAEEPLSERTLAITLPEAVETLRECRLLPNDEKLALLKSRRTNTTLRSFVQMALDWTTTYGLAEFEVDLRKPGSKRAAARNWLRLFALLNLLSKHGGTSKYVVRLRRTLERLPRAHRRCAINILNRDIALDVTLARRVWHNIVLHHEVQVPETLRIDADTSAFEAGDTFPTLGMVYPYTDGQRLLVEITNSRKLRGVVRDVVGTEVTDAQHLVLQAARLVATAGLRSAVLDCESIIDSGRTIMRVTDMFPLRSYHSGSGTIERSARFGYLAAAFACGNTESGFPDFTLPEVLRIPSLDAEAMQKWVLGYYQSQRTLGYAGVIVADMTTGYSAGRRKSDRVASGLLRLAPLGFEKARIIGYADKNGRLERLIVEDDTGTRRRISNGFTEQERVDMWRERKSLSGRFVLIDTLEPAGNFKRLLEPGTSG